MIHLTFFSRLSPFTKWLLALVVSIVIAGWFVFASAANAAEFLGRTATGEMVFMYEGKKMACGLVDPVNVVCITEAGEILTCRFREYDDGFFDNCVAGPPEEQTVRYRI